jgi:rod shape-determining protein MreC
VIRDTKGTRIVLGTLLVVAFAAVSVDSRSGDESSPLHPVRSVAASLLAPLEAGVAKVTSPVTGTVGAVRDAHGHADRLAELSAENARLRTELRALQGDAAVGARLVDLRKVAATVGQQVLPARVIALAAHGGYSWTISLDVGSDAGVTRDMTVLNADGLVGRVVSVTSGTATVLLAADPISSVGVRMTDSGEIGTLDGAGDDLPRLTLFDRHAKLKKGETLVTFGSRGERPFVAGVPVGEVVSVSPRPGGVGQVATVRPYAKFSALDTVGVVVAEQQPTLARAVPPTALGGPTP